MKRALLLNADYTPLHFMPDIEAFLLVYKGVAEIANISGGQSVWHGDEFTSPGRSWAVPATIRLLSRVNKRWKQPRFRKRVLFNRDNWQCQYCRTKLNWSNITIDHVQPKSRGGGTTWKNCVASCKPCNKRKADMTPNEAEMPLIRPVTDPSALHFWDTNRENNWHDDWDMFISR